MFSPTYTASATMVGSTSGELLLGANNDGLAAELLPFYKGDKGDPGTAGASVAHGTAGETLGGHRAVGVSAGVFVYASTDNPLVLPIGVTTGAALAGDTVAVQLSGELTEPSWSFDTPKQVLLGANGALTQAPPSSGMYIVLGRPINPTTLFIDISEPIFIL